MSPVPDPPRAPRLTLRRREVLAWLRDQPGGGSHGLAIAEGLDMSSGALAVTLAAVERAGWTCSALLRRQPGEPGRWVRRRQHTLTPAGRALIDQACPARRAS